MRIYEVFSMLKEIYNREWYIEKIRKYKRSSNRI